jgi:hypothetical protein
MHISFFNRIIRASIIGGPVLMLVACGASVSGTYKNASGMITLDLRSGGKAALTVMGENEPCTYEVDGKNMNLTCKGNKTTWDIHDDGSISGPGFVGSLTKPKS